MASQCATWNSYFQETCRCKQQKDHDNHAAYIRNATFQEELVARRAFTATYPAGASTCSYHQTMIQRLGHAAHDHGLANPPAPLTPQVFAQTIVNGTALLPMCTNCATAEGLLTAGPLVKFQSKDTCKCATRIIAAVCWFCELARMEAIKQLAIQNRKDNTFQLVEGVGLLKCACGAFPDADEVARKCVGCGGVKTAPFFTFSGEELTFVSWSIALNEKEGPAHVKAALPDFAALVLPLGLQPYSATAPSAPVQADTTSMTPGPAVVDQDRSWSHPHPSAPAVAETSIPTISRPGSRTTFSSATNPLYSTTRNLNEALGPG